MRRREWDYDASTSRVLRIVSHLPVAGIGGTFLLVAGLVGAAAVTGAFRPSTGSLLLAAVLVLVGGPISLIYLWPMLTDPDQRPSVTEFEGAAGYPFTLRSVLSAAAVGAVGITALAAVGVPFDLLYWFVVALVFSPLLVAVATTSGRLDGDELVVDGTTIPLERVDAVRSIRAGGVAAVWISYAPRSGVFLPRLLLVPVEVVAGVRETLRSAADAPPDDEEPDRVVQAVLVGSGLLLVAVGALAYGTVDEEVVQLYLAATLGAVGVALCLLGWRGL